MEASRDLEAAHRTVALKVAEEHIELAGMVEEDRKAANSLRQEEEAAAAVVVVGENLAADSECTKADEEHPAALNTIQEQEDSREVEDSIHCTRVSAVRTL